MRILVTGGAGYVGSHCALELMGAGHDVVVFDNLVNSKRAAVVRLGELAGRSVELVEADVCDADAVRAALTAGAPFDAVMHFAGLKSVSESSLQPVRYYDNNVGGTIARPSMATTRPSRSPSRRLALRTARTVGRS